MIIARLAGGLGNQMFQYACASALAQANDTDFYLDHSFLENRSFGEGFTYREYELNAFSIEKRIEPYSLPPLLRDPRGKGKRAHLDYWKTLIKTRLNIFGAKAIHTVWEEDDTLFDASFFSKGPDQYLEGFFQDERYFGNAKDAIRRSFTFGPINSTENEQLAENILAAENAVSVHVRRGDYLTLGEGVFHGLCSPTYYQKALNLIRAKVANPTFFVFSADDPEWARETFSAFDIPFTVVGERNTGAFGYENMRMMSLCKHNIIANSSFSWWGAWLNPNPEKIVIAPGRWFQAESHKNRHLALPDWHIIAD